MASRPLAPWGRVRTTLRCPRWRWRVQWAPWRARRSPARAPVPASAVPAAAHSLPRPVHGRWRSIPAVQHGDDAGHGCASPADARTGSPGCTPWAGSRQIPCGDGAMRAPGQPDVAHLARRGRLVQASRPSSGPRRSVRRAISSSSDRRKASARLGTTPSAAACAMPRMATSLLADSPGALLLFIGGQRLRTGEVRVGSASKRARMASAARACNAGGRWRAPALHGSRPGLASCLQGPTACAPSRRPGRPGNQRAPVGDGSRRGWRRASASLLRVHHGRDPGSLLTHARRAGQGSTRIMKNQTHGMARTAEHAAHAMAHGDLARAAALARSR